ncbi:MAG: excinuclease ABC subunit UvrB, partial [Patescibacteria group bacterium]
AIEKLTQSLRAGHHAQTLLGVTGSGKTYTVAHVIANLQKPTLVIAHNKTLAAQLTQEFRTFFPNANVEYFVSYYDYYQPEAYLPGSDVYIEKEADINQEIDRLRHAATSGLLRDSNSTIIVASVSCIYGLGSAAAYAATILDVAINDELTREQIIQRLLELHYERSKILERGRFRIQGSVVEIVPADQEKIVRIELDNGRVKQISIDDLASRTRLEEPHRVTIMPAKHFVASSEQTKRAIASIESELTARLKELINDKKLLEADRLERRTKYDLRLMKEIGTCPGIENYSRHFAGRAAGEPPETLIDYFPDDLLIVIDESHVTIPQIRGMYAGDQARKDALIDHGFRLPSARDNRPLRFTEFLTKAPQLLFVSATPALYELAESIQSEQSNRNQIPLNPPLIKGEVPLFRKEGLGEISTITENDIRTTIINDSSATIAQQVIRPTGLVDPAVEIRPIENQVINAIEEIAKTTANGERVLVTTLTKKMAEDLSEYLIERKIRAKYLHSGVDTLDRIRILEALRRGEFDVLVGVNLLREGLDLPEVSLVVILDADHEGFLRSETSLVQTIGRAARNVRGRVVLYADTITGSMQRALDETDRRRTKQLEHNEKHHITPQTIQKAIASIAPEEETPVAHEFTELTDVDNLPRLIKERETEMKRLARALEFEQAALVRDELSQLLKLKRQLTP